MSAFAKATNLALFKRALAEDSSSEIINER